MLLHYVTKPHSKGIEELEVAWWTAGGYIWCCAVTKSPGKGPRSLWLHGGHQEGVVQSSVKLWDFEGYVILREGSCQIL